ncbi:hypothetical protein LTR50_000298 [Elasticomyces elasticus]|nr:hypothetical protein LTR50_000298 [Elasticomyces elasticus]
MVSNANAFMILFALTFIVRYLRLIVNIVAYYTFKPRPLSTKPAFSPSDVTVIIPTVFSHSDEFIRCLQGILRCGAAQVIVVTANAKVALIQQCCEAHNITQARVIGVKKLNKRVQMVAALKKVQTSITVFADDDVFWPTSYLEYLLASFESEFVGAAGTRQRVRRDSSPNLWNFLGICYLERRNFNTGATNNIDGGISTLSGRTSAYRTIILKNEMFFDYFLNDHWLGRHLNSDDDKCLTRWTYTLGWDIALQFDEKAVLETTLESNTKFLHQCVRWARAHWRGNLTVMMKGNYWYSRHLWTLYAIYIAQFQTPALLMDGSLAWMLYQAMAGASENVRTVVFVAFGIWVLFSKIVKLIPHLIRYPQDVRFLPASVLFSYLHGFINIYALCTMHVTAWGSKNLTTQSNASEQTPLLHDAQQPEEQTSTNDAATVEGDGQDHQLSQSPISRCRRYSWTVTQAEDGDDTDGVVEE